jgi:hypothetical protein
MANRSDFLRAKLPRQYKRQMAMISDATLRRDYGKLMASAHASHVAFKMKRNDGAETAKKESAQANDIE